MPICCFTRDAREAPAPSKKEWRIGLIAHNLSSLPKASGHFSRMEKMPFMMPVIMVIAILSKYPFQSWENINVSPFPWPVGVFCMALSVCLRATRMFMSFAFIWIDGQRTSPANRENCVIVSIVMSRMMHPWLLPVILTIGGGKPGGFSMIIWICRRYFYKLMDPCAYISCLVTFFADGSYLLSRPDPGVVWPLTHSPWHMLSDHAPLAATFALWTADSTPNNSPG